MRNVFPYVFWSIGAVILLAIASPIDRFLQHYATVTTDQLLSLVGHSILWIVIGAYTALFVVRKFQWNPNKGILLGITLPSVIAMLYGITYLKGLPYVSFILENVYGTYIPVVVGLSLLLGCFHGKADEAENSR